MKITLPRLVCRLLLRFVWEPAQNLYPYFHLRGYMLRGWVLGFRSPERNTDNPQWYGKPGGRLYCWLTRRIAVRAHLILRSDRDRALHDHPCSSLSIVLEGGYWEVCPPTEKALLNPSGYSLTLETLHRASTDSTTFRDIAATYGVHWRGPGSVVWRPANAAHRLVLPGSDGTGPASKYAATLFCMGRKTQGWGFYPNGVAAAKVPWREYLGVPEAGAKPL
jgi:hypothetical protein